jgi:hypothetical protein
MRRSIIAVAFCVLLACAGVPVANAQDDAQSPQELWNEFPLEPSPTPARGASPVATPQATRPAVEPAPKSGDEPVTLLVALLAAAGVLGAVAAHDAARRLRRAGADGAAAAPAAAGSRRSSWAPRPEAPARKPVSVWAPASETCRIKLHNSPVNAQFFAVPFDGGPVLARSPCFKIGRAEGEPGLSAPDALRALVDELVGAGWRQTGSGRAPWDLRFERGSAAQQRVTPRG